MKGERTRTGFEVFDMLGRDLRDFEEADATFVVDEGTTLDVGLGLVGDLHKELGLGLLHVLQNRRIDTR